LKILSKFFLLESFKRILILPGFSYCIVSSFK
jgi:hypothetical protein